MSASTGKLIYFFIYKLVTKILIWADLDDYKSPLVAWSCFHKIAENYSKTGELNPEVWFDCLWEFVSENEYQEDGVTIYPLNDQELTEIIEQINNCAKNMSWVLIHWWECELHIQDDEFDWYIDLLVDNKIYDWKFVKNFASSWKYDALVWYVIQAWFYAYKLKEHWYNLNEAHFVEILKWDTLITDASKFSKDELLEMILEKYWEDCLLDIPKKDLTKYKLIERFPIDSKPTKDWRIIFTKDFMDFSKRIFTLSIDIRDRLYLYSESNYDEKKHLDRWIKKIANEFRALVDNEVCKIRIFNK
jgi:hypothetical protein